MTYDETGIIRLQIAERLKTAYYSLTNVIGSEHYSKTLDEREYEAVNYARLYLWELSRQIYPNIFSGAIREGRLPEDDNHSNKH